MIQKRTVAGALMWTAALSCAHIEEVFAHQANYLVYYNTACKGTNMIANTYSDVLASWHFGFRGFMTPTRVPFVMQFRIHLGDGCA